MYTRHIKTTLQNHYHQPAPCDIVEKYIFNTCDIQHYQKITAYMALIRRRSEHCNYGDKLEEHLRLRQISVWI